MKQFRAIQFTIIFFLPLTGFSQDTLFLSKQRQIVGKVIEVEDSKVKYRKLENLEGPIYSVDKSEILTIHYKNGIRDSFKLAASENDDKSQKKEDFLKLIKTPNVNVFITSEDPAVIIHAKRALQYATTWNLIDDKSKSQVVVRFSFVSIRIVGKKGKAQFLDPKTDEIIFETNPVDANSIQDVNTKRGVIDRIVNKEIKELLKD